jgi:hypothetical protein
MKTVATYAKLEDAFLARSRLEGSGIKAFIPDELTASMVWTRIQAMGGIRLQVEDEDYEEALKVLGVPPVTKGDLVCPYCGSDNVKLRELSATTGIGMLLGFLIPVRSRKADCFHCHRSFEFGKKNL